MPSIRVPAILPYLVYAIRLNKIHYKGLHRYIATGTAVKTTYSKPTGASTVKAAATKSSTSNDDKKILSGYSRTLSSVMKGKVLDSRNDANEVLTGVASLKDDIDWNTSWHGLGTKPFAPEIQNELLKELNTADIEIKPDGLIYLPEIKYRRILNKVFGAGGWGLVPRSETIVTASQVTREYGLICHGQLVSVARGEQDYFSENGIPTATEGCKSNALMRCCKDLGIGSELWDPVFIKQYKEQYCIDKFVEHITTKKKKKIWLRKDRKVEYPYK